MNFSLFKCNKKLTKDENQTAKIIKFFFLLLKDNTMVIRF